MNVKASLAAALIAFVVYPPVVMAASGEPQSAASVPAVSDQQTAAADLPVSRKGKMAKSDPIPVSKKKETDKKEIIAGELPTAVSASPVTPASPTASASLAFESECAWTGKRITSLLHRDDVDTALHFYSFYQDFGCPVQHLGKALGCVVANPADQGEEALADRVDRCWADPKSRRIGTKIAEPAKAVEPAKAMEPAKTEAKGPSEPKPPDAVAAAQPPKPQSLPDKK
ncbi:MAG: hypothetical protein HQL37_05200 [Alphaproteobacteria bacterium]|nr:hypothetical protein [Alphaproteobacteria bacterium]